MYNLTEDEVLLVDGGGDGPARAAWEFIKWAGGNALYNEMTKDRNYTDAKNINRTGSNQTYGSYGRDTGGCMMQGGGCRR